MRLTSEPLSKERHMEAKDPFPHRAGALSALRQLYDSLPCRGSAKEVKYDGQNDDAGPAAELPC